MKILIKITKEVLEKTKMCNEEGKNAPATSCAIAYAVRDIFPKAWVERTRILINGWYGGGDTQSLLPFKAIAFIEDFDDSTPEERVNMNPFSFEIDVPDSVINEIGIGQVYKVLSESKTLEYVAI